MNPQTIVILGAGFAGMAAATELAALLSDTKSPIQGEHERCEIILVDQNASSLFTPMLTEVVGGEVDPRTIVAAVRSRSPRITFEQGRVDEIEVETGTVTITVGDEASGIPPARRTLHADHLVIALGSVTNFRRIAGLRQHALTIKTVGEAEAIRNRVLMLLERADEEADRDARRRLLTFVVAGGGFAGVQTMAALNDLVRTLIHRTESDHPRYPRIDTSDVRTILIHSGAELLPEIGENLAAYARAKLAERGIEVMLNTLVTRMGASYVEVDGSHTHNPERLEAHTLIWTDGMKPSPVMAGAGLELGHHNGARVNACCALPGHPGIWVIGDCAEVPKPGGQGAYAPTVQNATRQGRQVARNILAVMRGEQARPFVYRPQGELVIVGKRFGVAGFHGLRFSGVLPWAMWRAISLARLPRLSGQARVGLDWVLDVVFGRDVATLPAVGSPGALMRSRRMLDQCHVSVLEALYGLERDGRSPANEQDLEEKLGYSDGAEFRRDRPRIEGAVNDFSHLDWVELDPRDYMTLTPAGRRVAALMSAAAPHDPMKNTASVESAMAHTLPQHRPQAADNKQSTIPPVEDLFNITADETDFMSAQSFPASDPPPSPSAIAPCQDHGHSVPSGRQEE